MQNWFWKGVRLPFSMLFAKIGAFQMLAVGFFSKLINNDVCCGNNYPKNNLKGLYPLFVCL